VKTAVSMLLALCLLLAPALAERYDSPFGYSMELPEGWLPLNADTYSRITSQMSEEQLSELGLAAGLENVIVMISKMRMEYLFSGDGLANASVTVVRQPETTEGLAHNAEVVRRAFEQSGATDAISGAAKFGEKEFQAAACTLNGVVVASYFYGTGDAIYAIAFKNASAEDISRMLSSAVFSFGAGAGASPEETAPADGAGPAGAVFALDGALKEPRG
jgi:hypothetical protein